MVAGATGFPHVVGVAAAGTVVVEVAFRTPGVG